jgi:hypothetical protein
MSDEHDDDSILPIERNVPIPPRKDSQIIHRELTYTFNQLQPGDSFWYPATTQDKAVKAIHRRAKEKGWKAATRREKRNGKWGTRIWRTE